MKTLCLSELHREKSSQGVVTKRHSWTCYEAAGHRGRCHGTAPDSPRWELPKGNDK
jgi:hypothetical protein